ncbi:MAG: undecaprenyl/decaprenyl-phosphate alpha-N-acetylglucosaminyl 1-phosphate transferase [Solirubrobacterales bacterium]|nr:undecaprenyl/decaprenyl-phosphate alpha-N-acetylglucosaminyl 1-phosphate transferase [Solirubrobacterales bacterium]MBV9363226.1 undecaprenyl/decaprenyl-phosphate alpha-N-acetylglucosaminyl 1-phosphate transferase [Solirubrobacterales bacterium]MBV9806175.1 undecaprenyl/decaprenyl-phosphate alpha-N-acetylglucosaminyl 1-phosphate transferase [Solirubrobacterales bacterium]
MDYWDALFAFLAAMALAAVLTPLVGRLAWRVGAVVMPSERGLAERPTPAFGGLAILVGVLVAAAFWLPTTINLHHTAGTAPGSGGTVHTWTVIVGACLITLVGAIDDIRPLAPQWKLLGQVAAAVIAVEGGAVVTDVTFPFIGTLQLPNTGGVLTVIWLVGLMNVVNFSDGIDGLAAGLCTIDGIAFAIIAFDLHVSGAGVLAALTAGAALGFLFHNFYPASVFMGDSGANLLGYLLGVVAVIGSIKTGAVVTLVVPLIVLAVPFLDTGFVLAKRLKYKRKPWSADANHFHHRMSRMGFSRRRTVAYLYAWTLLLAGVAVALRFIPYSNHRGSYHLGWLLVMAAIGVVALAASVYLIYLLEILKFKSRRTRELRNAEPATTEHEIDERVQREVETGEFERVG